MWEKTKGSIKLSGMVTQLEGTMSFGRQEAGSMALSVCLWPIVAKDLRYLVHGDQSNITSFQALDLEPHCAQWPNKA